MELRHGKKRSHLLLYLDVTDRRTGQLIGHLGDISTDGLMLIAERAYPPGIPMQLRIRLPDIEEFSKTELQVDVETRWTHPDRNPDLHCTGCLIKRIAEQDLELIEEMAHSLSFEG